MELFQWGNNPWGQEILIRVSLDILYLSFWAGVAFILFHLVYAAVWVPKLARAHAGGGAGAGDAATAAIPEKIQRHTAAARAFHWIMAASMLALIITGFFPLVGVEFPWLTIHWVAGVLLTVSVLYHIVHATFFSRLLVDLDRPQRYPGGHPASEATARSGCRGQRAPQVSA